MPRIVVVGAGVFGAWTAFHLRQRGADVTLVDAHGPANALASSGGESRVIRAAYGPDEIYARMAADSLPYWQELSDLSAFPIFVPAGVLFFFPDEQDYLVETLATHRALGLDSVVLDQSEMARRFPMIDFCDAACGIYEPSFGALMARRSVQTLVERFVRAGGAYVRGYAQPPDESAEALDSIQLAGGRELSADQFVFATGPWLRNTFARAIGARIRRTRQEVFYFEPPPGDPDFAADRMPVWADFNRGDMFYGFPDIEPRGVKFAHDVHGPEVDPDTQDRTPSEVALAKVVAFRDRRFPRLRGAALTGAEVCQYENSSSGDFLIDVHPRLANVLLVGGGSGHGFKHGPAVGAYAAAHLLGGGTVEPRFSLASKSTVHQRSVH